MLRTVIGIIIISHGLIHLWLLSLSLQLVPFKPEMGWNGKSWAFTNLLGDSATRLVASALFVLTTIGFAAGGIGLIGEQEWYSPVLLGTAAVSAMTLLLFWDGGLNLIVEKGLIGFLIDAAVVAGLLFAVL
jgi:hypothetical protein